MSGNFCKIGNRPAIREKLNRGHYHCLQQLWPRNVLLNMHLKHLFTVWVVLLGFFQVPGQNFDDYQPQKPVGKIPSGFLVPSSEKFQARLDEIPEYADEETRKNKEDFLLESSFVIDQLCNSGNVLFNDPITRYIRRVADQLLKDQPELKDSLRFYAVKSAALNAFTTNRGEIFVNLGLIAQLENEAQLAFILCHEIQHFVGKHPMDRYVEVRQLKRATGIYRKLSFDELLLAKNNYSQNLESEADREGLKRYLASGYNLEDIKGVFDVLLYSYLPFDDDVFDPHFLEAGEIIFPPSLFLTSVAPINADEFSEETMNTHPDINSRRRQVLAEIKGLSNAGRKTWLVSQDDFIKVRKIARFDVDFLLLQDRKYAEALYTSFLLMREDPESRYLNKIIVKSLYALARYHNAGAMYSVHPSYHNFQGNIQQLAYLLEQLAAADLNVLALSFAWENHLRFPDDLEIKVMLKHLWNDLGQYHYTYLEKMSFSPQVNLDKLADQQDTSSVHLTKYEKIRLAKERELALAQEADFSRYAFVGFFEDPVFLDTYRNTLENYKSQKPKIAMDFRAERKAYRRKKRQGISLGATKVVFVDPLFKKIDHRRAVKLNYLAGEEGKKKFVELITDNAQRLDLNIDVLRVNDLHPEATDKFNDLGILNSWISERFKHEEVKDMMCMNHDQVQYLVEKYGTPYFAWTGMMSVTDRRPQSKLVNAALMVSVLGAPYVLFRMLSPTNDTYYFSLVYDLRSGKLVMDDMASMPGRPRRDYLNSSIYNTLLQMKSVPRKSMEEGKDVK